MQDERSRTKIDEMISNAIGDIKKLVNMETVVGDAIDMGNDCKAYPIIKITVGMIAGGGEYSNKIIVRKRQSYPFAGGTGAGFTAEPIGFLISTPNGCEMVSMQAKNAVSGVIDKLSDAMAEYIKKVAKREEKRDV
ncbi:MAG: hypothetical protein IKC79_03530 [Clostridia bacterium]|nr:hypothetical protein [Clostridia bacterium]